MHNLLLFDSVRTHSDQLQTGQTPGFEQQPERWEHLSLDSRLQVGRYCRPYGTRRHLLSEDSQAIVYADSDEHRSMWMRFLGFENESYRQAYNISPQMRVVAR
jgi:hypothetical protein